jgi:hypothetical protein
MVVQANTQGFILVRAERPYVQFELSCSCTQKFVAGVTNGRERDYASQVSGWLRGCVCVCVQVRVRVCVCGCPAWSAPPPFIAQGVRVYREGKRECGGRATPDPLSATERRVPLTYLDLARGKRLVHMLLTQYSPCPCGNGISTCQPDLCPGFASLVSRAWRCVSSDVAFIPRPVWMRL